MPGEISWNSRVIDFRMDFAKICAKGYGDTALHTADYTEAPQGAVRTVISRQTFPRVCYTPRGVRR